LTNEKLLERHDITLSVESTRQLMIAAGYWKPRKGAKICVHPMREELLSILVFSQSNQAAF